MRFKKGAKVEVLIQKEEPTGSWHCAEIVGGNGHTYMVRYDGDVGVFGRATVERVPRKAIRPCPPSVDVLAKWVAGDVVEVFHDYSWKMATVLKASGGNQLSVRILGSSIEYEVNKHDVRPRLCWQDGEWIAIGKASNKSEDLRFRIPSSRRVNDLSQKIDTIGTRHIKGNNVTVKNTKNALGPQILPSRTVKRKSSYCHSQIEAPAGRCQKVRAVEKGSVRRQVNAKQQALPPEKVVGVACSRDILGEKYKVPSYIDKMNGHSEIILEREKPGGAGGCSCLISLDFNIDDGVSSSVGSCSVNRSYSQKFHHVFAAGHLEDDGIQCSDAESVCQSRSQERNGLVLSKEELTEELHRLELHAYRCTIQALHASGPLSWEQELLLTNLRDSLHISNDEHLTEIRNLVSSSACITSR